MPFKEPLLGQCLLLAHNILPALRSVYMSAWEICSAKPYIASYPPPISTENTSFFLICFVFICYQYARVSLSRFTPPHLLEHRQSLPAWLPAVLLLHVLPISMVRYPPSTHPSGQALTYSILFDEYARVIRMVFKCYEFQQRIRPLDYTQDYRHWDLASWMWSLRRFRCEDCQTASRSNGMGICRSIPHVLQ